MKVSFISYIHLTPPHFCSCPKAGPGFQMSYVVVFFMFNDLRWEVFVCFVNIGGIVDHHCSNFLIIIIYKLSVFVSIKIFNTSCCHELVSHYRIPILKRLQTYFQYIVWKLPLVTQLFLLTWTNMVIYLDCCLSIFH